jgi:hypothetical protein
MLDGFEAPGHRSAMAGSMTRSLFADLESVDS